MVTSCLFLLSMACFNLLFCLRFPLQFGTGDCYFFKFLTLESTIKVVGEVGWVLNKYVVINNCTCPLLRSLFSCHCFHVMVWVRIAERYLSRFFYAALLKDGFKEYTGASWQAIDRVARLQLLLIITTDKLRICRPRLPSFHLPRPGSLAFARTIR